MARKMLINATHPEENRVAIVEDGILTELDIEVVGREQTKGNIYKATVVRVESGLQAAFVDYGGQRLGFLQLGELHPSFFGKGAGSDDERRGRQRIGDVLRRGQEILVQIVKGERGTKGAALTTFLSLAGRYMVLMPESDSKGVSRKIEEESVRKKLKGTMNALNLPDNMGYIVRTAGIDQSSEELKRDFDYLVRVYNNIVSHGQQVKAPALIYKESNLVIRSIRDYFSPDIDEVLVDDPKVLAEAKEFFQQVMPECVKLVKLHQEKRPIFSRYQIEEQIETISKNKVPLPSGGSIVIDRTEALVAIDVNSGKMAGEQGIEATAYKTNLEAAEEAARQLRLRDLGGLIVIDFIDMRDRKHGREVEKGLKEALKNDKAKVTLGKISQFGLLEMTRQRIKDALAEGTFLPCPHCAGSGRVKSVEAQAVAFLRKLQAGVAKGPMGRVEGEVPLDVATYLLNSKRHELVEMEERYQLEINIHGRPDFVAGTTELTFHKREQEDELYLPPVTAGVDLSDYASTPVDLTPKAPAPAAPPAPVAASAADEGEGGEKKKAKRRRKKKGAGGGEETGAPAEGGSSEPAAAAETAASAFTPDHEESVTPQGEGTGDDSAAGAEKRKRKRRRRKKKGSGGGEEGATAPADDSSSEAPAPPMAAASLAFTEGEATAASDGARKKRRRRRKKKGGSGASAQPPAAAEHAPDPAPVAPATALAATKGRRAKKAEVVAAPPENIEPAAKPRRTRKPAAAAMPAAVGTPAAAPIAAKSRRRSTSAAAAPEVSPVGTAVATPVKRPRRPKKSADDGDQG